MASNERQARHDALRQVRTTNDASMINLRPTSRWSAGRSDHRPSIAARLRSAGWATLRDDRLRWTDDAVPSDPTYVNAAACTESRVKKISLVRVCVPGINWHDAALLLEASVDEAASSTVQLMPTPNDVAPSLFGYFSPPVYTDINQCPTQINDNRTYRVEPTW